jgi:hypothetical protein
MSVRMVGIAMICAAAVLGAPPRAGAGELSLLARAASAETMMRRQPAPVSPRTTPMPRRQRKGTISLGMQFGYGVVRGSSELNDHFDRGVGYGFRFRYIVAPSAALGFSFENQHYGPRAGLPLSTDPFAAKDSTVIVTTVASEMLFFFHRERPTTPYVLGGLGFASPDVHYETKESRRVDEGPFVVVGAGIERFFRPHASFDFTLRGYAEVGNSELSLFSQLTAGIHLYPGD